MNTTIYKWKDCRITKTDRHYSGNYTWYELFMGKDYLATTQTEHKNWKTYIKGVLKARVKTKVNVVEGIRKEIAELESELTSNSDTLNKYAEYIEQLEAEGKNK